MKWDLVPGKMCTSDNSLGGNDCWTPVDFITIGELRDRTRKKIDKENC